MGKRPDARCGKRDDDRVEAYYACPVACADGDDHTADTCVADFYDDLSVLCVVNLT